MPYRAALPAAQSVEEHIESFVHDALSSWPFCCHNTDDEITRRYYGARKIAKLPYQPCVLAGDHNRVTAFAFFPYEGGGFIIVTAHYICLCGL